MDVGAGQPAAAGAPHVVEYLLATETVPVPRTPRHCRGLLFWRGRMIPVIDLAPLIAEGTTAATATRRAVVLAWQERPGAPLQYGALLVTAAPGETWVSDDMAGDLAAAPATFRYFARAGFMKGDQLIPILDVRRLFGRALPAERTGSGMARRNVYPLGDAAPAANEAAPYHAVAEDMATWQTFSNAIDLLEVPATAGTSADAVPGEIPHIASSTVVIPFSAGKAELRQNIFLGALRAEPEAVFAPEEPIADKFLSLDEKLILATESEAAEAELSAITESSVVVPIRDDVPAVMRPRTGTHTGTIESFERLRALKQKTMPPARDGRFRRRAIVIALVLGVLCATGLAVAYYFSSGAGEPGFALRDAAPGGIDPHSIPATPAQPPK